MAARKLGRHSVWPIGLGCMNLSHAYGAPPPFEDAERLLLEAVDQGTTLFDTAALYGFGANETLLGRVLKPHHSKLVLASKGGIAGVQFDDGVKRVIDGSPEAIRRNCEDSLKRLQTDHIDLYYLHRWDKKVPIEESVGAMADLVRSGKVGSLGLSEVSAATLRRAHAEHPIAAVQTEYSLWTRNAEIAVLDACREIGAAFVAFSPVARAFLADALHDVSGLDAKDIRRTMPRFQADTYAANLALLGPYRKLAASAGVSPAQLALAWLLSRGEHVIPIYGTTSIAHLRENHAAGGITVAPAVLAQAGALINQSTVVGERYNAQSASEVDTEEFSA